MKTKRLTHLLLLFSVVLDLIYWRDVKKSGVVFGSMMLMLLSLAMFSVLSVVAYLALAGLTVTVSFRVYKNILGAVQKSGEGHPFKWVHCAWGRLHQTQDWCLTRKLFSQKGILSSISDLKSSVTANICCSSKTIPSQAKWNVVQVQCSDKSLNWMSWPI